MKNLALAILSTVTCFAITTYALNNYDAINIETSNKKEVSKKEKTTTNKTKLASNKATTVNAKELLEDFKNWDSYTKENIDLMATYDAMDDKGRVIKKSGFLTLLRTGMFIPVEVSNKQNTTYQLYRISNDADPKIKKSIKSNATVAYRYYAMEGKKLPKYNFVDLNGKSFNKAATKGKMLVLKCWFITCKICVEEFPELNELVDKYKDDNIAFVSLAFDEKDKLKKFLETKEFKYATIPLQKDYMAKKLKVKQYPTHLIVDENGVILKMVNNVKTLAKELELIKKSAS